MLNSKFLQKINCANFPKSRSRSIYRGNQSHTASMNLKIQCDLSPQTLRQPKQSQKSYKQTFKQNKNQKMRDSLRIVQANFSGKKTQRQDMGQKSSKNILVPARQLQTQRVLKQSTNANIISRKQSSIKPERTTMATITLTSNKKQPKTNERQEVAISQQQLKEILMTIHRLDKQNKMLKKQISLYLEHPQNTVTKALL